MNNGWNLLLQELSETGIYFRKQELRFLFQLNKYPPSGVSFFAVYNKLNLIDINMNE